MTTFQKLTKVCAAYSVDSLAHTRDSVENNVCPPYPSEPSSSNRQWYYLNAVPHATTTACKDIKDAKPSSKNGYYTIKIRGNDVRVFCRMGAKDTYIDISAESRHSGDGSIPTPVTYYFTRAKIVRGPCLLALDTSDYFYSTTTGPASQWKPKSSLNG
ncbi:uncharacterized protein LOC142346253 [Convolutriloba macropyga]|uniref:uncharacterized protein LOC142346253 n=1 Tax=Convolutriloba macropyga TaxID=536237 RepID=UPI003F51FF9C